MLFQILIVPMVEGLVAEVTERCRSDCISVVVKTMEMKVVGAVAVFYLMK